MRFKLLAHTQHTRRGHPPPLPLHRISRLLATYPLSDHFTGATVRLPARSAAACMWARASCKQTRSSSSVVCCCCLCPFIEPSCGRRPSASERMRLLFANSPAAPVVDVALLCIPSVWCFPEPRHRAHQHPPFAMTAPTFIPPPPAPSRPLPHCYPPQPHSQRGPPLLWRRSQRQCSAHSSAQPLCQRLPQSRPGRALHLQEPDSDVQREPSLWRALFHVGPGLTGCVSAGYQSPKHCLTCARPVFFFFSLQPAHHAGRW